MVHLGLLKIVALIEITIINDKLRSIEMLRPLYLLSLHRLLS